jgi:hypothetical protein
MTLTFVAYVLLHSPLRTVVAHLLGRESTGCYFICGAVSLEPADLFQTLAAWLFIGTAAAAACVITDRLDGPGYERPICFGLVALALVVVPTAAIAGMAAWAEGNWLKPPMGPLLGMLPSAAVVGVGLRGGWRPSRPNLTFQGSGCLLWLLGGMVGGLLTSSILINLMHPATGGDALSYHAPLAVFLWGRGNLVSFLDQAPGTFALANPGTAELWYGLLRLAGGEHLANFGQLPFALLGSAAVAGFTRRTGLQSGAARLAALAFLLGPLVVMQIGMQPNDVAGASLIMCAMVLTSAAPVDWGLRRAGLVGLALGLTATTKLALLPMVAGTGAFALGVVIWHSAGRKRDILARLSSLALGFLVVAAPWWIRNLVRYGNPLYPAGIPFLGRGVFVSEFGAIDREFVPHPIAWPLYPLIEPHDDRSGFGALFVVGLLPGLILASRRGRGQPLAVYAVSLLCMLPAWWLLTMHEPRFFLAQAGLGFAFLPWGLAALRRHQRRLGAVLVGAAAVFSALLTLDQALVPFARQPMDRLRFYDVVWGVDPVAAGLPEGEGLLHNTGYAPSIPEYAAYYPLLGPSQSRQVLPVDTEGTTEYLLTRMLNAHVHYAYVAASPEYWQIVERLYDPALFELVHVSVIHRGERSGARRFLYRVTGDSDKQGVKRYLFRLREPTATRGDTHRRAS